MKKLMLILALTCFGHIAFGQSKSVETLYNKYKSNDDFFHMDIGGNFMNFAKGFNVKLDEANVEGIVTALDRVKLFKLPQSNPNLQVEFKALQKSLESEKFELLMEAKDKGNAVLIFTKGNKVISDVVVLLNDKGGDMMVVELLGAFDSKTIADAGRNLK